MSQSQFTRVLGRRDVIALAFGAMIGWSWVALSGGWVQSAGGLGAALAFLGGGLVIVLIGLTYAELAAAMPHVGGEHVYSLRALGTLGSFVCTWAIILGYVSVVAFEAIALPTVLSYLSPAFDWLPLWIVNGWQVHLSNILIGSGVAVLMCWINIRGIRPATVLQTIATLGIIAVGVMLMSGAAINGNPSNLTPAFTGGIGGLLTVVIIVPMMLVGFDVIPQSAEEINLPFAEIGKVLVVSVLLALAWYIMIVLCVALALDTEALSQSDLGTADANAYLYGGDWAGKVMVLGGIAGILTSWNAFIVGGSRAIFAMAQSGMLPSFLGKLHPKYQTPQNAILLIGLLSVCAPLVGRPALVWLIDAGSFGIVVAYIFVALSFLVLRRREPGMTRPYKVPNGRLVGLLAFILSCVLLSFFLPFSPSALLWPQEWLIVFGWAALGALFWFLRTKPSSQSSPTA